MAITIFPSELWRVILEHLQDADEILTVLHAFPDLQEDRVLHGTKPQWLFGKTFPFISRWLTPTDNLNCRRVCRKWQKGVDELVEISSDALPFEDDTTGRKLSTCQPFIKPTAFDIVGVESLKFVSISSMQRFSREMPTNHNYAHSFPIRAVEISYCYEHVDADEDASRFWSEAMAYLEKFGIRIWYLYLYDERGNKNTFISSVLNALRHTPNLKSLRIGYIGFDVNVSENFDNMTIGYAEATLRAMSEEYAVGHTLKTIHLSETVMPLMLINLLFNRHCQFLKKVVIHAKYWKQELGHMMPQLGDLTLLSGIIMDEQDEVTNIIESLTSSVKLSKLSIDEVAFFPIKKSITLEKIIPLLVVDSFHLLEHLQFFSSEVSYEGTEILSDRHREFRFNDALLSSLRLTSVSWLDLGIPCLVDDINFLYMFPNLKKLQLWFPIRHKDFFQTSKFIWEITCPRLSVLYVNQLDAKTKKFIRWNCTRMEYESFAIERDYKMAAKIQSSIAVFELEDFPFFIR